MDDLISRNALLEQGYIMYDEDGLPTSVVLESDVRHAPTIQQPEWISCAERLPEFYVNEDGICCTHGKIVFYSDWSKTVHIGYCIKDTWLDATEKECVFYRWYDDHGDRWEDISHWMPLPQPPKEGE